MPGSYKAPPPATNPQANVSTGVRKRKTAVPSPECNFSTGDDASGSQGLGPCKNEIESVSDEARDCDKLIQKIDTTVKQSKKSQTTFSPTNNAVTCFPPGPSKTMKRTQEANIGDKKRQLELLLEKAKATLKPPPQTLFLEYESPTKQNLGTKHRKGKWTSEEHNKFLFGLNEYGRGSHREMAKFIRTRTLEQIRSHSQKYFKKLAKQKTAKRAYHDGKEVIHRKIKKQTNEPRLMFSGCLGNLAEKTDNEMQGTVRVSLKVLGCLRQFEKRALVAVIPVHASLSTLASSCKEENRVDKQLEEEGIMQETLPVAGSFHSVSLSNKFSGEVRSAQTKSKEGVVTDYDAVEHLSISQFSKAKRMAKSAPFESTAVSSPLRNTSCSNSCLVGVGDVVDPCQISLADELMAVLSERETVAFSAEDADLVENEEISHENSVNREMDETEREISEVISTMEQDAKRCIRVALSNLPTVIETFACRGREANFLGNALQDPGERWRGTCDGSRVLTDDTKRFGKGCQKRRKTEALKWKQCTAFPSPSPTPSPRLSTTEELTKDQKIPYLSTSTQVVDFPTAQVQEDECHGQAELLAKKKHCFDGGSVCFSLSSLDTAVEQHIQAESIPRGR